MTDACDEDLFGDPVEPVEPKIPPRGTDSYWSYINSLTLPDGLTFLSLAPEPPPGKIPRSERRYAEAIYAQNPRTGDYKITLVIDNRTGRRWSS
jgi:hypothetical protein